MDFKQLLIKKRVVKTNITKLKDRINVEIAEADSATTELFKTKLTSISTEVSSVFDNIYITCAEKDIDSYVDEYQEVQNTIDELYLVLERSSSRKIHTAISASAKLDTAEVKLPNLSLPTFNGSLDEWLTFSDLFRASVHNNVSLSDAQKLQYLKGSCKSEALKIIQAITISDSNYKIAWELLEERFSNKRELVNALIKKLIAQPNIADSAAAILNLVDVTNECVRSLSVLEQKVDGFANTLVTHLIVEKLDKNTRIWYERQLKGDDLGTLEGLLSFLKDHARTLQNSKTSLKDNKKNNLKVLLTQNDNICFCCKKNHYLWKCDQFIKLPVDRRFQLVKSNKLCFNCLSDLHNVKNCKNLSRCKTCHNSHHSLLHFTKSSGSCLPANDTENNSTLSVHARVFSPQELPESSAANNYSTSANRIDSNFASNGTVNKQVLLCTASIRVRNSVGKVVYCRALLDTGSQANFITETCLSKLGLVKKNANFQISCLGSTASQTNGELEITFSPHFDLKASFSTSVFVIDKICGDLPQMSLPSHIAESFGDLVLADPKFYKSAPIDILLGVNVFMSLILGEPIRMNEELPTAVRSKLGWIISGNTLLKSDVSSYIALNNVELNTEELVKNFWSLETVPEETALSKSELKCEEHFKNSHFRNSTGRYVVRLPFKISPTELGDSREMAFKRFLLMENRMLRNPELYELYKKFLREYLNLHHMEIVPSSESTPSSVYYLPHHPVFKPSSTSTKLRVVFDASAKTSRGCSLNDLLYTGQRIQQELFEILIRFRTYPIAICADVEKMFRQIRVHQEDTDYQRILWREDVNDPIQEYRLLTVTYGTTPAPFLATRCLLQLALDEQNDFPQASKVVRSDFYVDDLLTGAKSRDSAKRLVREMDILMRRGGFNLRKWLTNAPEILEDLSPDQREEVHQLDIVKYQSKKVLGINWQPLRDTFDIKVLPSNINFVTKRNVLSEVARLFDPLGWLAPSIIFAKIFLQELWTCKLGWDEPLNSRRSKEWMSFHEQLILLDNLKIPRVVILVDFHKIELHAFCDSSERAYCAAIYVRSISEQECKVSLLCAKTRVAPLKAQSLPRLELCAALLLANLLNSVMKCLDVQATDCFAWSDSTVTLCWVASESRRWLPFVANRVSKIQDAIPDVKWNHVQGKNNPADYGTRGLQPGELIECETWFNGPEWLQHFSESAIVEQTEVSPDNPEIVKEERKTIVSNFIKIDEDSFLCKYSSWLKLSRIIAYCLRFIKNCSNPNHKKLGFLSSEELNAAIFAIVRNLQLSEFPEEMQALGKSKPLKSTSRILSLSPFLDNQGLLRVGGRLKNSEISYDQKHPLLLPQKHFITKLIIRHYHEYYLHAAPTLLLAIIRQKFWIVAARSEIRKIVKNCVVCCRHRAQVAKQMMANLPTSRITITRAFVRVGLDFAGPFMIKHRSGRGQKSFKSYVCIFVCFVTRAVHFETVEDLSARVCLEALKRFIGRRGKPKEIYSDCGSNFKGVSKEIRNTFLKCQKNEQFLAFLSSENVKWNFIPPAAPHFGGLWESGIKSMKYHLRRSLGAVILTYPEFTTLITQIEACMNSRPLCPQSEDPTDLSALTPGHFLIGAALTALPEENLSEQPMNILERWKLRQAVLQSFWKRWSREYLCQLQQRVKWNKPQENLSVNDLVLIKEDNIPPLQWKLGRIVKVYPGADNKIRVVDIRTCNGEIKRPIVKLCPLHIKHSEQ